MLSIHFLWWQMKICIPSPTLVAPPIPPQKGNTEAKGGEIGVHNGEMNCKCFCLKIWWMKMRILIHQMALPPNLLFLPFLLGLRLPTASLPSPPWRGSPRLNLYLHSGQVALANQCLSQGEPATYLQTLPGSPGKLTQQCVNARRELLKEEKKEKVIN